MRTHWILGLTALTLAACGGGSGEVVTEGTRIALASAKPGTCVVTDGSAFVNQVQVVSCTGAHEAQVAGSTTLDGDSQAAYPGWFGTNSAGYDLCQPVFEQFTGTVFWDSPLDIVAVTPSASTWRKGDRLVTCLIVRPT
jgi:hypothetical protein